MNAPRILVVDDNTANRKLISEVLAFDGYRVTEAVDAETALESIRTAPPDLILMDIALPGMDGLALSRLLKADPKTSALTIVALTAFAMKGDEGKAREAGCDGYITKPIDTRKIAGQIDAYLRQARAHRPPGE